jgi:hypothetical protein
MQKNNISIILSATSLCFFLITGCNSTSNVVLTNDDSIRNLNEIVKERFVRVKTANETYEGENLIIGRDSTFINNFPGIPRVIPNSNIKEIRYSSGSNAADVIELNNKQILNVYNIHNSNYDTVTTFDESLPVPFGFPTKYLILIQYRNHLISTLTGMGIGLGGGVVAGTILGLEVGLNSTSVSNSGVHRGEDAGIITVLGSCGGGLFGALLGGAIGAGLGGWKDINVTVNFEKGE